MTNTQRKTRTTNVNRMIASCTYDKGACTAFDQDAKNVIARESFEAAAKRRREADLARFTATLEYARALSRPAAFCG